MLKNDLPYYVTPDVEITSVTIERGYSTSMRDPFESSFEDPEEEQEMDW